MRSQEVEQSPQSSIIQEVQDSKICNSSKTLYSLPGYGQKHGEGPIFLMMLLKGGDKKSHNRIGATLNGKKQQYSLYIMASQPSHTYEKSKQKVALSWRRLLNLADKYKVLNKYVQRTQRICIPKIEFLISEQKENLNGET